eukprot:1142527-Pleurochrysis_carterae.AAC.1
MASPPSERASGMFSCSATGAAAELGRAVRAAKKAHGYAPADRVSTQPPAVPWAALDMTGRKRWGALTVFRMKDTGAV